MMKTITSNINWENAPFVEFRDESGAIILMFEDKSSVLGNKVCVYDANENVIFFLDEDVSQNMDVFNIQKETATIAVVQRTSHLVRRDIIIEPKSINYSFHMLQNTLMYENEKAAKLLRRPESEAIEIELYKEDDTEFLLTLLYTVQLLLIR